MEKEINKKMARYVELSEKFSKSERDIFTEEEMRDTYVNSPSFGHDSFSIGSQSMGFNFNGQIHIDGREIYVDEKGVVRAKDEKRPLTRGQQLEATATIRLKERAILMDEYDEYMKLRTSLNSYFNSVNKLINE
jgi:hypothetical protein